MTVNLPPKTDDTDSFFRAFRVDARVDAEEYRVIAFGHTTEQADEALKLVLTGIKRAIDAPLRDFEVSGVALPKLGDHAVVIDGRNRPRCVLRVTETAIAPFASVDAAFAFDVGEGDQSRDGWLRDRRAANNAIADDTPMVFTRFTVVWPRLFADDWSGPPALQ